MRPQYTMFKSARIRESWLLKAVVWLSPVMPLFSMPDDIQPMENAITRMAKNQDRMVLRFKRVNSRRLISSALRSASMTRS